MNRHIPLALRPTLAIIAALSAAFASISQAGPNIHPKPSLEIDGGHVVVNDDDADHNQEWDKDKNPTPDEGLSGPKTPEQHEPKLQKFTFTAKHTSEPGVLVITVAPISPYIKLWEDAGKNEAFVLKELGHPVSNSEDTTVTIYVEGLAPTPAFDSIVFTASFTVGQKTAVGEIKFGVTQADIDIDSDNDAQLAATFTDEDDKREFSDKTEHPGKILLESTAAIGTNGVAASVMQSAFAPLRVTLQPPFSTGTAKVKFSYPASVPSTPATSRGLRLWKANGNGSVFIAPGQELPWNDIADSGTTATLYVEYVEIPGSTKTYSKEDILITVTDPEGAKKGQIKILSNTTPLPGKESPDGLCVSLLPVEIDYIDPDDSTWQILAADGHVYLHDKSVKARIRIRGIEMSENQLHNSDLGEILLKSSFTGAGFQETVLPVSDPVCEVVTETGYTEIRITIPEIDRKRLNLLPSSGEPDLTVYSALDYISDGESNLSDSQAFIDAMKNGLMGQPAGYAHNLTPTDLSSLIPHSQPDGTFLQSAGCEVLSISFQSASKPTQIMNQGEMFYFSGHGFPGVRATGPSFTVSDTQTLEGSDIKQYWNDDLNLVVIAGCSVVNINNWNPNPEGYFPATFGPDAGYYPGEFMNLSGPRFILGYGSSAPRDTQNADGIASTFTTEYLQNTADPFTAWRVANDNSNGRNATAIERNVKFGYFERVQIFGVTIDYVWNTKNFNEW